MRKLHPQLRYHFLNYQMLHELGVHGVYGHKNVQSAQLDAETLLNDDNVFVMFTDQQAVLDFREEIW